MARERCAKRKRMHSAMSSAASWKNEPTGSVIRQRQTMSMFACSWDNGLVFYLQHQDLFSAFFEQTIHERDQRWRLCLQRQAARGHPPHCQAVMSWKHQLSQVQNMLHCLIRRMGAMSVNAIPHEKAALLSLRGPEGAPLAGGAPRWRPLPHKF